MYGAYSVAVYGTWASNFKVPWPKPRLPSVSSNSADCTDLQIVSRKYYYWPHISLTFIWSKVCVDCDWFSGTFGRRSDNEWPQGWVHSSNSELGHPAREDVQRVPPVGISNPRHIGADWFTSASCKATPWQQRYRLHCSDFSQCFWWGYQAALPPFNAGVLWWVSSHR